MLLRAQRAEPSEVGGKKPSSRSPDQFRPFMLDEDRRTFLRMVSHELRTPLNSIIGFSELIARELHGPIDPKYREHAEVVRDSGLKLLKLVNQIMEIARLEAGTADLDIHPEPIDPAIADAINGVKEDAERRDVRFRIQHAGQASLVMADPRGLRTILSNLLQNAVAASPESGEVRVSVRPIGGSVAFEITDDGPGVPQDQLERILRPFEQSENTLSRGGEGSGLGLTIVRLLCQNMGGKLRLRCDAGGGLTALVRLPAASETRPAG